MNHYINSFLSQWKVIVPNLFNGRVFLSSIILTIVALTNPMSGKFLIPMIYGDNRVSPLDIVFRFIPYQDWAFALPEIASFALLFILIVYCYRSGCNKLEIYLQGFILLYLLRAVVNLMTPFASPPDIIHEGLDTDKLFWDAGYFFSGHTGYFILITLYTWDFKILRIPAILSVAFGIITILIARHHYTIDIYGGIMTALVIYKYYVEPRVTAKPKNLYAQK